MKKIIVTVGPSLLHRVKLKKVHSENLLYRINGAHGNIIDIENTILEIRRQIADALILIDLPGNKVRTSNLEYGYIDIEENKEFELYFNQFNFQDFYKYIKPGDIIWANDSIFKFEVKNIDESEKKIKFFSYSKGRLLNNKGFHIRGVNEKLPFLFEKDKKLIELADKHKVDYIGLSFVRNEADIKKVKELIKYPLLISKVETISAVKNLDNILKEVEYILVDRGDLSTEIGLVKVPEYQKFIIDKALFYNKKVFLATQFLKSMENNPIPTIAEIIDMYNTLKMGIYGVQLSEETAVGKYPKESINVISEILEDIQKDNKL